MSIAEIFKHEGRQLGLQEGLQQGLQEGLQKGKLEGKLEIARNLLSKGIEMATIVEITQLPLQEIKKPR